MRPRQADCRTLHSVKVVGEQFAPPCGRETVSRCLCGPLLERRAKRRAGCIPLPPLSGGLAFVIGGRNESTLIDISLLALTRAWFATVVAVAVLLASFAIEQDWNSAVYWRGLPQAFELIGDEGPPIVD